jgi:predicted alpha/beta superfamily hydrolase
VNLFWKVFFIVAIGISCGISAQESGEVDIPRSKSINLIDAVTKRSYKVHIQVPMYYRADKKYAVVYMVDSPYTFQIVTGAAFFPVKLAAMEEVIFVGISSEVNYDRDLSRQRDFTPTRDLKYKDATGEADKHVTFIRNQVIAYVEKNYHTDPSRRTYIGNSFGGLLGAYILVTQPNTFKNYVLSSPSLWWDDNVMFSIESKSKALDSTTVANIFISSGSLEKSVSPKNTITVNQAFYARLKERKLKNVSLKLVVVDGMNHGTVFPAASSLALWWLFNVNNGVASTR